MSSKIKKINRTFKNKKVINEYSKTNKKFIWDIYHWDKQFISKMKI